MDKNGRMKTGDIVRRFGLLIIILVMVVVMSFVSDVFLTTRNMINVVRQVSINGILAVGMTLIILTGGIDLSVGSLVAVTGVVGGSLLIGGFSPFFAVILSVLVSVAFGAFNGLMISYFGLPPFIATLAGQTIGRGFALVYSKGRPFTITDKTFLAVGKGSALGIPIPIWILVGVCVLTAIILNFTTYGRYIYAIGGNRSAAKLSGINVKLVEMSTYVIMGLLAGVVGIILAARISSGQPTAGEAYELDAIAAVAIGGTSMTGGIGTLSGTLMGFIIMGILSNSLILLNVSSFYQQIVKGAIILIAVLIDMKARKRKE